MASDESRQLAKVAAVTADMDKLLDRLFATVAELKVILGHPPAPPPGPEPKP